MSFKVGAYSFTGRYATDEINEIKDLPGLYAILCRRGERHGRKRKKETMGSTLFWHFSSVSALY